MSRKISRSIYRNLTSNGEPSMTRKDLTQRLAEEKEWRTRANVKRTAYKSNGDKPEDNSDFDPLYGGEGENLIIFPRDRITPWWDEETKKREGIMSNLASMTTNELKEFYGGYLTPYGYREKDIMKMPLKEIEYLFNQVMSL